MPPWNLDNYPVGSPDYLRIKARMNELARIHRAKHKAEIAERAKKKWRENPELAREKSRLAYARRAEKARARALERYYETKDDPDRKARARATTEEWKQKNPDRYKALQAEWYERNKDRLSEEQKQRYAEKTKDLPKRVPLTAEEKKKRSRARVRKHAAANREKIRARSRERWKDPEARRKWNEARSRRFKENPEFLLRHRLRTRMKHALEGHLKAGKTMELIGCSTKELRRHIERQWTEGMNWSNYGFGPGTWQVDHIRPLVSFSLADPEQQRIAFRFDNLQPLWYEDHLKKSASETEWRNGNRAQLPPCPPPSEVAQSAHETLPQRESQPPVISPERCEGPV